jgi:PAS domain S-box-containing protein
MNAGTASVFEFSEIAVIGSKSDGTVTSCNRAAERLYGYAAREIMGKSAAMVIPTDRRSEFLSVVDCVRGGQPPNHLETLGERKDGTLFEVSLTLSPINDEGRQIGVWLIGRDLTEQRRGEAAAREIAEDHVRRTSKLEAIGRLAGDAGNDLNDLLFVMLAYCLTLRRNLGPADFRHAELEQIENAAGKVYHLTQKLLAFGEQIKARDR